MSKVTVLSGKGRNPRFKRRGITSPPFKPVPRKAVDVRQDKQLANLKKSVVKLTKQPQLYYCTLGHNITSAAAPTATFMFSGIVQGDTIFQRRGQEIIGTSLKFRGYMVANSARLDATAMRVIVFWAKGNLAGAPTAIADTNSGSNGILNNDTLGAALTSAPSTFPYSLEYTSGRNGVYDVIFDREYIINPRLVAAFTPATGVTATVGVEIVPVRFNLKFHRRIRYDSALAGLVTDLANQSLWMVAVSDGAANPAALQGTSRFIYKQP